MEVTITLIICLSVVFIITLGIISCTLRDENFKARFDKSNERLKRIIKEQHDELISYREAIKKNDANLKESLKILASASDVIKTRMSRLKDTEETLSMLKVEVAELNLGKDKSLKKIDEAIRSFSESAERIVHKNETEFKWLDERLVQRPSHLSPEEKKNFMEYMQTCSKGINKNKIFVTLEDVKTALECVGTNNWGLLYDIVPSEGDIANGQNTERNQ